ncbi:MAG TPA: DUF692 domain-containing protein [Burkholderiaceae bacterium]|nr:DUF692 domain-containing protein [Burkholderiaceae bacterium]
MAPAARGVGIGLRQPPGAGIGLRQPPGAGVGLRQSHYAALLEGAPPPLGFVEVHAENFFADGGAALQVLRDARARWPVSLHGVGLALGSAAGLDAWHLDRLARLAEAIEPVRISDHACFARAPLAPGAPIVHGADLLPVAFTAASLDVMTANVGRVQERLRRPILVENLSAYVSFADDAIDEPAFLAQLCARSGCGLLLDVNNLMVNALNAGAADPLGACRAFIDALPASIVGEIHLAGYSGGEGEGGGLVIDDHGSRVRPAVWAAYAHALARFGAATPTLVEWDTDVPALEVLLGEAARADAIAAQAAQATDRVGA